MHCCWEDMERCRCPHHKVIPVLIMLLALVLLLGNLEVISPHLTGILWPIALGLIGLQKMFGRGCSHCRNCMHGYRMHTHEHEHKHEHEQESH